MAINLYLLTATVVVAAGTPATVVAGEPGTGGAAGYGNIGETAGTWAQPWPTTFLKNQEIALDPAGQLFTAIGGGNLRQITPAQDDGSGIGTGN